MPYIVREGDPLPWFQGTSNALGSLMDLAMNDRRNAQGAAREEAQYGRQRQASAEDFTRNRAAQQEDYATRRADENARDLRNFGQTKELQGQAQTFQQQLAEARRQQELADVERKRSEDLSQGEEFLRASGLAEEVPGSILFQNPPTQVPKLGLEASKALAANKRMMEQSQMSAAEREADNQRLAAIAAETARHNRATEALRSRSKPMQPPEQKAAAENAGRYLTMYQTMLRSFLSNPEAKKKLTNEGWSEEMLRARIQTLGNTIQRNSPMAGGPPVDSPASNDGLSDDELDALLLGG
jgi:hypothetical protein